MASHERRRLDEAWTQWLHHNVSRGCSIDELTQILRREGFDERSIRWALQSAPRANSAPPAPAAPANARAPRANLALPAKVAHGAGKVELYTVDDFLAPDECESIVALIREQLRPSEIATPPGGEYDRAFRTSRTCDLSDSIPAVAQLDAKISAAIGFERSLGEPTQGQHYEVGQVFKTHTDFFKPYELERFHMGNLGQRTWTFMIYLNDVEGGGETEFPDIGLKVTPRLGRAVLWNNLLKDGHGNDATRHQSLPVTAGTKTIITKWFRMPIRPAPLVSSPQVTWKQTY